MKRIVFTIFLSTIILLINSCGTKEISNKEISNKDETQQTVETSKKEIPEKYTKLKNSLKPFFKTMGEPQPDEWLFTFKENGQTFEQYITENPTLPTAERNIIYIQPIGRFSVEQRKIINLTAEYMEIFFNLKVKLLPETKFEEPLSLKNYRIHPQWKIKQIRTGFIIDDILMPKLPADAAAMIAFTNEDLFPDASMNYVFGQANLYNRVGVWSLYRLGEKTGFETFLTRTLKVGIHETGHMFSISHCTLYECVMSGSNHLGETDKHPLDACPECAAKVCWMTDCDAESRYEKLAVFGRRNNLSAESLIFEKKKKAVQNSTNSL